MEENNYIKLQQIICPSCRRPINTFNPKKLMAECPFCHSQLINPLVNPKNVLVPERIIPFTTDESMFEEAMIKTLVTTNYVPTDIFDSISTGSVIQAYLPMYLYEGTFNASWSCESANTDVGKNGKEQTTWLPQNGSTVGNFSFLCLANENSEIPDELRSFTYLFPYDVMMSKDFNIDMIDFNDDNLLTLERDTDSTLVWEKHGKDKVEEIARNKARYQLGNRQIQNFRASCSYNLNSKGSYIYVPFWFVYYTYGGRQYYFLMDGVGERKSFNNPIDKEVVNTINNKKKIKEYYPYLLILALVLYFSFPENLYISVIYLSLWFFGYVLIKLFIDQQIQELLDETRTKRSNAAQKL